MKLFTSRVLFIRKGKPKRKSKGQSKMGNPDNRATMDTKSRTKTNKTDNTIQTTKKISKPDPQR